MNAYFMWLIILIVGIFGSFLLTGCVTPDQWGQEKHSRMIMQCRAACGKDRMVSYESWTGQCGCRGGD